MHPPSPYQRPESRGLIGELYQDGFRHLLTNDPGIGRAVHGSNTLARDVVDALDGASLLHQELAPGQEEGQAELEIGSPLGGIGHRLRDQINTADGSVRASSLVAGVDSLFSSLTGLPTFVETAGSTPCSTRSMEKPTHSLLLLTYAKGGELALVPMTRTPVREIFSSVPSTELGGAVAAILGQPRDEGDGEEEGADGPHVHLP